MKSAIVLAAVLFMAPAAFASQVVCSGDYFGYTFTITAKVNGTKIVGKPSVVISDGDSIIKSASMTITSAQIVPQQEIHVAGGIDGLGQGTLDAGFDASSNSYKGNMVADTSMGSFTIGTTCQQQ